MHHTHCLSRGGHDYDYVHVLNIQSVFLFFLVLHYVSESVLAMTSTYIVNLRKPLNCGAFV